MQAIGCSRGLHEVWRGYSGGRDPAVAGGGGGGGSSSGGSGGSTGGGGAGGSSVNLSGDNSIDFWRELKDELGWMLALAAFTLSGLSFYVSYVYKSQELDIQVTSVSFNTNQGELYMTVAFSNGNTTIIFHYNTTPVVQGLNTMHIPPCAFNCGNGCVQQLWADLHRGYARICAAEHPR